MQELPFLSRNLSAIPFVGWRTDSDDFSVCSTTMNYRIALLILLSNDISVHKVAQKAT